MNIDVKDACENILLGRIPNKLQQNYSRYSTHVLLACAYQIKRNIDNLNQVERTNAARCFRQILCKYGRCGEGIVPTLPSMEPRYFLKFPGSSPYDVLKLPMFAWTTFRGYTISFWCYVEVPSHPSSEWNISLYKFCNSTNVGVEAVLRNSGGQTNLVIRSSGGAPDFSVASAISALKGRGKRWRSINHNVSFTLGEWHNIVIVHQPHYVRKSTVECYIDASHQFCEVCDV